MTRLNERQIIKIFQNHFGNKKFVSEDVETFKLGSSFVVVSTDTLVESTDVPNTFKIQNVARKSIVACVSDFACKGVKPVYGIISVTIPSKYTESKIKDLVKGITKAAKEFNIKILGGDTNEGMELTIQVFLIGLAKKIIPRNGAKINDVIITTGPFGYTGAALRILLDGKKAGKKFADCAKRCFFKPNPRLGFGLSNKKYLTSAMDSSDGLSSTLHELARQSKKKFVITKLPSKSDLLEFAKKNKISINDLIFNGGEEYEIVSTINPSKLKKIQNYSKKHKITLYEIGHVTSGSGVIYQKNNKSVRIHEKGWMHFKS